MQLNGNRDYFDIGRGWETGAESKRVMFIYRLTQHIQKVIFIKSLTSIISITVLFFILSQESRDQYKYRLKKMY